MKPAFYLNVTLVRRDLHPGGGKTSHTYGTDK